MHLIGLESKLREAHAFRTPQRQDLPHIQDCLPLLPHYSPFHSALCFSVPGVCVAPKRLGSKVESHTLRAIPVLLADA